MGLHKEAEGRAESSGQPPALEIDIGNPQMPAGTIHTPKEEVAMASPNSPSLRSPMAMQVQSLMLCEEGIAPTAGRAHLVNKHAELLPMFDQDRFDSITMQLQVATSLPNIVGPRSRVHGLAVFDAMACDSCTVVYTKQKKMRAHHGSKHGDLPIPQHWRPCKAQRMKPEGAGTVRQLWEVATQARAGEDSRERALADKLLGELEEQAQDEAVTMIDSTDELVLQWLNSPDPVKGHQHDGTLKKYMHPVICFITMLLRDLWMIPDANMVILKLDDMLQEPAPEQSRILAQLHAMLLKVWTTPWSKSKYHIVPIPRNHACPPHSESGWLFQVYQGVTTLIAKFEYCMRLTFLREIRAHASAGDIEVDEEAACDALQPWFTEKNYSTFARLRSLQHRASAISFSTMALPSIWWTDGGMVDPQLQGQP
ncbi:hypothetical protein EDC04DRAFT_2614805, partial [Pisolithus marmoratus]